MGYVSAQERMDRIERLRRNMRSACLSRAFAEYCIAQAPARMLGFLDRAFQDEADRREASRKANIVKSAGFPVLKSIDEFDFSEVKLPEGMSREELLSLSFIRKHHSLIMYGICGSGKTMLSICLGMLACSGGYRVRFYTLSQLAMRLKEASDEGRLEHLLQTLRKLDLLIIDEWGYTRLDKECSGYIFQVIADSYERKSLIVTTNLPFSEWGKIVADEQLAAAIIDRIVHYGYSIDTGTKDWRISSSPMNRIEYVRRES